jgi:two-component system cell cycle response regulator
VPLLNEAGGLEGVVGTFSDITDRKTAEKALREAEGLKVLTQTAAATAHEIYQPLTVVCGYAEILLSEPMPDRTARTRIEAILKAGRKIQEIVDQMKELHRYITKPYALGQDIVDFDRASRKDPPADQ